MDLNGLDANMLRPSVIEAGLDPDNLPTTLSEERAARLYGSGSAGPRSWRDIWSAGNSVSGVAGIPTVKALIELTHAEYFPVRRSLRTEG